MAFLINKNAVCIVVYMCTVTYLEQGYIHNSVYSYFTSNMTHFKLSFVHEQVDVVLGCQVLAMIVESTLQNTSCL